MRFAFASAALLIATPAMVWGAAGQDRPGRPVASRIVAGTYQVDPAHTQVAWRVDHMGFSVLEGMFPASAGTLRIDPARPADTRVDATFAVDQVATTFPAFAAHLRSDQIFDTAKFPTARFVSTSVTSRGSGRATLNGDLTIHGVTRPVSLAATFVGAGTNPMTGKLNIGFGATGTIRRSEFGLGLAAPAVSDEVQLEIHAAFVAT